MEKLEKLRDLEGEWYPNDFRVTGNSVEANKRGGDLDDEALDEAAIEMALAGRVVAVNSFGKSTFIRIQDRTGVLQAYVKKDLVGDQAYLRLKLTDVGDIVGVEGTLFRTRTGELTLKASLYRVLTKGLRQLPEKWHGLKDIEQRQRMRYVDLMVNEDSREVFRARAGIISHIREFLDERDFMEVETPMMHSVIGGANARPFVTHHNALDMDLYLRIAPELYLKRLLVGGLERVYEVNRSFRNEGLSTRHNPEFTMLEFYWAYATYNDLMDLTEELIGGIVRRLTGAEVVEYRGEKLDFSGSFRRLTVCDSLREYCGVDEDVFNDPARASRLALDNEVEPEEIEIIVSKHGDDDESRRNAALEICMAVFDRSVEERLIQPTFLTGFPLAVSPLARRSDFDPTLADRFELYVAGGEIANAFSELNDPMDQKERFLHQVEAKASGDQEAMEFDEDYIRALEYGMPPAAGEGIGIDRLTMVLTGRESIRDVILFPLFRPEGKKTTDV